ncbi:putative ankyrin repeat protein [Cladobotryum mycophilum]|uniref:Ankyrin repeat protein n=1 Tax=Cladobotryum mycophilum TaxID=491253 RepID=A0ABR0S8N5_9HYPO
MDSFSVTSLTTLCSSISHAAISSASEIDTLLQGLNGKYQPVSGLPLLVRALEELRRHTTQLETSLNNASCISVGFQRVSKQILSSCDGWVAVLHKQLMRLQPETITRMDQDYVEAYRELLEIQDNIFALLASIVAINDREKQDVSLNDEHLRGLIEKAETISRPIASRKSILLEESSSTTAQSSSRDPNEPPPYSAEAGPSNSQAPSSSGSWGMFSLKNSLKAFASALTPKPGPFVSALCQAATLGDVQQVAGFLSQGANINGRNENGNNALQCAILSNNEGCARFLIAAGAVTGGPSWPGIPPLFFAASAGSIEVARLLLEKGASINDKSVSGQSYFVNVVKANNLTGVRFLLEHGASARTKDISGQVVIAHSVRNGHDEMAKLLLESGADVDSTDLSGSCLLSIALSKKNFAMTEVLLSKGANPNASTISGFPLLAEEIVNRRYNTAKLLLENGADPNTKDWHSQPVLLLVLEDRKVNMSEKIDLVQSLLQRGADANAEHVWWHAPAIRVAMDSGNLELVSMLLEHKASATATMKTGETLLQHAIEKGRADLVEVLLRHGADPNATTNGRTALMQALVKQDIPLIKALRDAGADTTSDEVKIFASEMKRKDITEALGLAEMSSPPGYGHEGVTKDEEAPPSYDNPTGQ